MLRDQWSDRCPLGDAIRPALGIVELRVGTYSAQVKDRGRQIGWSISLAHRQPTFPVGLANHLPRSSATTGDQAGEHIAPVMPAGREDLTRGVLAPGGNGRN